MSTPALSVVYVLSNPAMPGLVKIGKTQQDDPNSRVAQLYTTGVPVPFTVEFACHVPNPGEVETAMHAAFGPQRINQRREFFRVEPEQVIALLKLLHVEDATLEVASDDEGIDVQDREAAVQMQSRRPNFNFEEMGISEGSTLRSTRSGAVAVVVDAKRVLFEGNEMSLTAATQTMMQTEYQLAPGAYWSYEGRVLKEIYDETYASA